MNLALVSQYVIPDLVIDVGARIGDWYREAKEEWPNAQFYLIEGNKECEPALKELGVPYSNELVSDREKQVSFYTLKGCSTGTGCSIYRENTEFFAGDNVVEEKRIAYPLDKLCEHLNLDGIILLKIDVQGSELDVLKGGTSVVRKCEAIIVEQSYVDYNIGAPLADEVDQYLIDSGFNQVASLERVVHPITRKHIGDSFLYV